MTPERLVELKIFAEETGEKMLAEAIAEVEALQAEVARLRDIAESAVFHYWHCDNACGQARPVMAEMARAIRYSDPAVDDDIATALAEKGGGE